MMKRFFLLSFLLFSFAASAQIWAMSLDEARRISRETNKFLIMEFKAIWCVPCERMKAEYWYNPKYKSTLDKFVIVTVDIDSNHDVARHYKVKELPNVKITDYKGEVYYELMGYYGTKDMENYLSGIPENPGDLYQNLDFENEKVPTDEELMLLSGSYQSLAQRSTNRTIKHEFINFSNNLFNKCIKTCKNQDFVEKSYLSKSFNSVLLKSSGKAIREIDISRISDNNKPYALYILANAHLEENNAAEADKLIREIEQTGNQQWISYAHLLKKKYSR